MPVNREELANDIATNPEYQALVREQLAKKDFIVQDKTEHASYLDRYKSNIIEQELPARVKAVHDGYDKDIKELYGVDRDPNEKSYDYLKRAAGGKLSELQKSADKIKELEAAIASGTGGKALQAKLEAEEQRFNKILKEREAEIKSLQQKASYTEKSADVKLLYGDLKKTFIKDLPPLFARSEAAILDYAINHSVVKDGKLYLANAEGGIAKDASYNEITLEGYLREEFKDVILKKEPKGGSGSNPGGGGGNGSGGVDPKTMTADNFPHRDDIKTKAAYMDYMISLGLKQGDANFNAIYKKYALGLTA